MEFSESLSSAVNIEVQSIILAAAQHDIPQLRKLLKDTSVNVQDPESGQTPLHAAILACEDSPALEINGAATTGTDHITNGDGHPDSVGGDSERAATLEAAIKTVKYLLQNGAIWNDVDTNNETPGCIALRLGQKELYEIMVDAGVRAEMLLSRLDEYEKLENSDSELSQIGRETADPDQQGEPTRATEGTNEERVETEPILQSDLSLDQYLESDLNISDSRIVDADRNGVMMAWETSIMKRSVSLLCTCPNLRVLNIGHGMGIIDDLFQETSISAHHIIEAHPDILNRMRQNGWYEKPNIVIHEGKWQDVLPKIIEQGLLFDAVYFDTFAEEYKALRSFFSDHLIGILDDVGKWGFFNGLGADRQICYDVYQKVVEMDLFEAGFETEWETMQTPESNAEGQWSGVRRRYWKLKEYKLPICTFLK